MIDLSANTNYWGAPPAAVGAAAAVAGSTYPTRTAEALRHAVGRDLSISAGQVTTGCGSDDVLASAFRTLGRQAVTQGRGAVVAPVPTFSMVEHFAASAGLAFRGCPFASGYSLDVDALITSGAALAYVASPNNPTGTAVSRADITRFLDAFDGWTILDEAYVDFGGETCVDLIGAYHRLLVVRTFSKAFGLAGLRIGYAVGASALIGELEAARGPFQVNAPAEQAAIAALGGEGRSWVDQHVREAVASRTYFQAELAARRIGYVPSQANFVLVPVPDAAAAAAALAERGLGIRPFPDQPGLGDTVRITVAPRSVMLAVADALQEVLQVLLPDLLHDVRQDSAQGIPA